MVRSLALDARARVQAPFNSSFRLIGNLERTRYLLKTNSTHYGGVSSLGNRPIVFYGSVKVKASPLQAMKTHGGCG